MLIWGIWLRVRLGLGDYWAIDLVDLEEYQVVDLAGWVDGMGLVLLADLQALILTLLVSMEG